MWKYVFVFGHISSYIIVYMNVKYQNIGMMHIIPIVISNLLILFPPSITHGRESTLLSSLIKGFASGLLYLPMVSNLIYFPTTLFISHGISIQISTIWINTIFTIYTYVSLFLHAGDLIAGGYRNVTINIMCIYTISNAFFFITSTEPIQNTYINLCVIYSILVISVLASLAYLPRENIFFVYILTEIIPRLITFFSSLLYIIMRIKFTTMESFSVLYVCTDLVIIWILIL